MKKSLTDEEWNNFGYDSNESCDICGKTPAKVEPRFFYATCREHADIPPADRLTVKVNNSEIRKG